VPTPVSDAEFALAFARLLEVIQNGRTRPATPADVLELLEANEGRYLLKRRADGAYMADEGKGWTRRQRDALRIPDRAYAHEARKMGLREHGVSVKVVRLRRKGTCGLEAVKLRTGITVNEHGDGLTGLGGIGQDEAMAMLALLTGAKDSGPSQ
jgi:hypothetical protein